MVGRLRNAQEPTGLRIFFSNKSCTILKSLFCLSFSCSSSLQEEWYLKAKRGKPKSEKVCLGSVGCSHKIVIFQRPITSPLYWNQFYFLNFENIPVFIIRICCYTIGGICQLKFGLNVSNSIINKHIVNIDVAQTEWIYSFDILIFIKPSLVITRYHRINRSIFIHTRDLLDGYSVKLKRDSRKLTDAASYSRRI